MVKKLKKKEDYAINYQKTQHKTHKKHFFTRILSQIYRASKYLALGCPI